MLEKMRMKPFFPENEDPISPNAMLMTARSQLPGAGGFPRAFRAPSELRTPPLRPSANQYPNGVRLPLNGR